MHELLQQDRTVVWLIYVNVPVSCNRLSGTTQSSSRTFLLPLYMTLQDKLRPLLTCPLFLFNKLAQTRYRTSY
jgi:hypothetical protein